MRGESDSGRRRARTRRSALRLGAATGVALLAGCTEDVGEELPPNHEWPVSELKPSLPVEERTSVVADRIEAAAAEDVPDVDAFREAVDEQGVEVADVTEFRDVLALGYLTGSGYETGIAGDLGLIAGAYVALVERGYDAVALAVTLLDDAPEAYGSAEVETEWAEAYAGGAFTAEEFAELVLGTVESHRHEPAVEVEPTE